LPSQGQEQKFASVKRAEPIMSYSRVAKARDMITPFNSNSFPSQLTIPVRKAVVGANFDKQAESGDIHDSLPILDDWEGFMMAFCL
jgi:hypothetical protein